MINFWPLLLPAAALSGWWASGRNQSKSEHDGERQLSREYVVGLNYLLNEQPDKAVDVFIKLLEVDSDTVETHLALGSLFRRRGEVDRAIRIHQNLIARPELSLYQRKEALMALAHDYMSAGVFDRAEHIFLEVVKLTSGKEIGCLRGLLAIYQQEKSWENALDILRKLEHVTNTSENLRAAHYYCEIALQALKNNDYNKASLSIKSALQADRKSVRASIMLANFEMKNGRYKQAIKALKRVPEQDPDFLSEVIEPLVTCHRKMNMMEECIDYFEQILAEHPRASLIFVIGEYLRSERDSDLAIDFVSSQLTKHPSIRGLNRLIYWHLESAHGTVRAKLQMLYDITSRFLDNKPIYRCSQCGYGGKLMHWQCPSCKEWSKLKPIHGLEGD